MLVSKKISGLPVVNENGQVLGMIRRARAPRRAARRVKRAAQPPRLPRNVSYALRCAAAASPVRAVFLT